MPGLGAVLDIGRWALFSSQSAIETTGNNIANVNTPGYSRRKVILEEAPSIDYAPGQLGTGVRAKEIVRIFNDFIEKQYLDKYTYQERWRTLHENLDSVQAVFKNKEEAGVSAAVEQFFASWQDLAQRPDDSSVRTALLGNAENLIQAIDVSSTDLQNLQMQINDFIEQDVEKANKLIKEIAELNRQITARYHPGQNNPNELYDKRNSLIRDLSQLLDVTVIDHGGGDLLITTKSGYTLVDGIEYYRLALEGPQTITLLTPESTFDGQIYFSGSDEYEYTLEAIKSGSVVGSSASDANAAKFKISIDGGKSWLTDENGNLITIPARNYDSRVTLPTSDVQVWFGDPNDPNQYSGLNSIEVGDTFHIVPKHGLYWYKTTSSKVNITPMVLSNGEDNTRRLVGGTLAGMFYFRDNYIGEIKEKFNEFAKELIWEVNRIHSQGAGLQKFGEITGTYSVQNTKEPLGSNASGLFFYDKLSQGNFSIYIYDKTTGKLVEGPTYPDIDGDPTTGQTNFDPNTHSLEDITNAINNDSRLNKYLQAQIIDNKLNIKVKNPNYQFAFGDDTTGLLAALGINTFFEGTGTGDIAVNSYINQNLDFIAAGKINGAGEANPADNTTANSIAALQYKQVSFTTKSEGTTKNTLQGYYNSLTATVGAYTQRAEYNYNFFKSLATDLDRKQKEISGVNLDEEMSNLLKFQQAYTAAAKLITVSEQMMSTIIQMLP